MSSCGERKPNSNAAGRLPFQQIVLVHNDDKQTLIDYRVKSVSASTRSPQVPPTWLYTVNSLVTKKLTFPQKVYHHLLLIVNTMNGAGSDPNPDHGYADYSPASPPCCSPSSRRRIRASWPLTFRTALLTRRLSSQARWY